MPGRALFSSLFFFFFPFLFFLLGFLSFLFLPFPWLEGYGRNSDFPGLYLQKFNFFYKKNHLNVLLKEKGCIYFFSHIFDLNLSFIYTGLSITISSSSALIMQPQSSCNMKMSSDWNRQFQELSRFNII